jgi:perosamine synthetase
MDDAKKQNPVTRRTFVAASAVAAATPSLATANTDMPALLGGTPVCEVTYPSWPVYDKREEDALTEVVRSGAWGRGNGRRVTQFEEAYARMTGAKGCIAAVNGTNALYTSLNVLGIKAGDEVLVNPFTFVASINVIVRQHALPVFVDTDPDSYLMDTTKLEGLVNERTKAIMPIHIGGSPVNMDGVMTVARKHNLAVVEDACQAWMAQWKGKNVGRIGNCGCFSFQATKNINCGEGGAIISDDEDFVERCFAFHNQGLPRKRSAETVSYQMSGTNLRLTEFQAALLLVQLTRMEEHQRIREQNAAYLASLLDEIPGIRQAKMHDGCTRNSYHIFMAHYDKAHFANMPREKFLKAIAAEGAPFRSGYRSHRNFPFLRALPQDRAYKALFTPERLKQWEQQSFDLPQNDRVCDEHVWFGQSVLLSERSTMDKIAEAVRKVHRNAGAIAKA